MLFAQRTLEVMAPGGAMTLTSSVASQRANGRNPAYEASKAAQIALARSIALAGEPKGSSLQCDRAGICRHLMGRDASRRRSDRAVTVPFGRQATGWEVAYAALFLISNEIVLHQCPYFVRRCADIRAGIVRSPPTELGMAALRLRFSPAMSKVTAIANHLGPSFTRVRPNFRALQARLRYCSNRTVMAPLTRNRALDGLVPNPLAIEYYGQRASAGLLISEATQISQQGQATRTRPASIPDEQVAGWREVTDRVHERGGHIYLQLWHVGRISHTDLQPNNGAPVAPSAIRAKGKTFVGGTFADVSEPRALELSEIPGIIDDFKRGAANAIAAGFDGVEVHGANGYPARAVRQGRRQQAHRQLWRLDREPRAG